MEAQLQELLNKIQDEGVKEAERKAALILKDADAKAEAIIAQAKKAAAEAEAEAERRAEQAEKRGREALTQASRDLILKLNETIRRLFDGLLKSEMKASLQGGLLDELAVKLVSAWKPTEKTAVEFQLSGADAERLKKHLAGALSAELRKGVTLKPVASIDSGFRIGEKDGTVVYDFTDAGLAEMLAVFVNPLLAGLIRESAPAPDAAKGKKA